VLKYHITFAVGAQIELSAGINKQVLPLLHQAVRAVAAQAKSDWQEAVYKAKLWSGEKDAYAKSINWDMTGDFSAMVTAGYKYAEEIESGRPPRDLKKMLDTSPKVRRTKDGRRFLVIPFRHNTPGYANAMPAGVHSLATQLTPSSIVAQAQRPSGEVTHLSPKTGMHAAGPQTPFLSNPKTKGAAMVNKNVYSWGQRITRGDLKAAGADAATVKRYAGMVRMNTSTPGGAKSSGYMTFRIMMEGSSGWIVGAKPGLYLAKEVAEKLQPKAEAVFAEAVKRTIKG
jgi:hypothetical protein